MLERFGAVTAISMREKDDGTAWAYAIFAEAETAAVVCSYMTISEAGHAVQIARPDFKRMGHGDKKVFGQVWRETLRKTKYGKVLDSLRTQIEQSVPGGVRTMLKDFKHFRNKSRSGDNLIDVKEFGAALRHCNLQLSDLEVAELFEDLDVDQSGGIDQEEFTTFVMGRHHALGVKHSSLQEGGEGDGFGIISVSGEGMMKESARKEKEARHAAAKAYAGTNQHDGRTGVESQSAAVDRSVWVGDIPHDLANERAVRAAMGAFGVVDAVQLRLKGAGQLSWAFVIMGAPEGAHTAVAAGVVAVGGHALKLEPVALKRELHAGRQSKSNPEGALGDVWRKTVQQTSHGKQLDLLRPK